MATEVAARQVTIAGRRFELRRRDVERALSGVDPEPVTSHFVIVDGRRYPPKQAIGAVTGLDRADFTTHQARRTLMRLGFSAGRRTEPRDAAEPPGDRPDPLRPYIGRWVATKDGDVLHAADTPQRLVGWLTTHGQYAESVFRVPEDELAATGLAPL